MHSIRLIKILLAVGILVGSGVPGINEEIKQFSFRLEARCQSLSEGSIQFENYAGTMSQEQYKRIRSKILKSQLNTKPLDIVALLKTMVDGDDCKIKRGYKGAIFYKAGDNMDKWRLTREAIPEFSNDQHLAEIARQKGLKLENYELKTQDVAYNGEYVLSLNDNKNAVYYDRARSSFPRVSTLDISLSELRMMGEKGARPGQTISTFTKNGNDTVVFADEKSSATYTFSKKLGYAPLNVTAQLKGRDLLEMLYAYSSDSDDEFLPRPCISIKADFLRNGTVKFDLWSVNRWLPRVAEEDLKIKLPEEYVIIDRRFGKTPLIARIKEPALLDIEESGLSDITEVQDDMERQGSDVSPEAKNIVTSENIPASTKSDLGHDHKILAEENRKHRFWLLLPLLLLVVSCGAALFLSIKRKKTNTTL